MDRARLQSLFEQLDAALASETVLLLRGGAAVLALGFKGRVTMDLDVLPGSSFVEADLRQACDAVGLGFNPEDKDWVEQDYLEVVPEETLVLPCHTDERPYNTVFRGRRLVVKTPPAADLVVGKLKRLDQEDLGDVAFLVARFELTRADLDEAYGRLAERFKEDPVLHDNLRYVMEDLL
jgi:hypothetical protein